MTDLTKGFTLGILGGGQLGRMSAVAAAQLGIDVIIYCPEENAPAAKVVENAIFADYNDEETLQIFSEQTDIITYEFENIPIETIEYLESLKPGSVLPEKTLLHVSQDRTTEKNFVNGLDIETARWKSVDEPADVKSAIEEYNLKEFILKTARFGYDGKGQIRSTAKDIDQSQDLLDFLENTRGQLLILEECIDFNHEISVIIARDKFGKTETYGPMLNEHKKHILHKTHVPADISAAVATKAIDIATKIADAVNLIGVLTVEFFVCSEDRILVNEIAPRTHNSGHWTIDACATSQFENHVRAVCGLPILSPSRHSDAEMLNIIGENLSDIDTYLGKENANIHLYGKRESRPDRKMGHITFLKPKS